MRKQFDGQWLQRELDGLFGGGEGGIKESIKASVKEGVNEALTSLWHGFVGILPELMGYGAMLTGALAIFYAIGDRGIVKPFAVYGGLLIVSISVLAVN